ncbi:hypothetical protein THRCLA_07563 [Thraustotheca clavata]|uniref:RING-CH-type domain-containing protein n=1 Tax=Thraustotheca clavata TaxID=74557 RepID=A0A1V9ZCY0_9STRA|nr:hypothetical protein THRCLA_07563 [Thraustotheca clavata]
MESDEEVLCRYCFGDESDGPLISPCKCSGGQKYVHLDCLRRWQRMVLVSQPTHPAFYSDDKRHHVCNVCLAKYTCPPPSRAELMASFTGPEIAALIEKDRLIAASQGFSEMLEADRHLDENGIRFRRSPSSYDYWFHGVYLINEIIGDSGEMELQLPNTEFLNNFRRRLTPDPDDNSKLEMHFHGAIYVLLPRGSLEGVQNVATAFETLEAPATVHLQQKDSLHSCADDHVTAVCISRPLTRTNRLQAANEALEEARRDILALHPSIRQNILNDTIHVQHYAGGPCDDQSISACLVLGGALRGYTIYSSLKDALLHVYRLFATLTDPTHLRPGQGVRLTGLVSRSEINGELGMALKYDPKIGRWQVRLVNQPGGISVKPSNLEPLECEKASVYVFWGDAQWTRAQLLGEIAKGSWGLCRAMIDDFLVPPTMRWGQLQEQNRLAYAPVTEMSEDYIRNATEEMVSLRPNAVAAEEATQEGAP